ncbi:MAG TPA: nucleotidyltransferase domain-containing protein [Chloroflexia bacterium]|nr:nucleotidyltransferase domain-containing protein [Chloroflexia bacterium]
MRQVAAQTNNALMQEIVKRIVDTLHPIKIVLFGSRARRDAHAGSDIDLLVIAHSTQPRYQRAAPLYGALSNILVPMDIMVYTPEEVYEWSSVPQAFVTTAMREGKILYEDDRGPGERLALEGRERSDSRQTVSRTGAGS